MDIIIGMLTTLIAFGAKYYADLMWLKSPRIAIETNLASFTKNPYRSDNVVIITCSIIINNYSKNETYNFRVHSIVFSDNSVVVLSDSISRNKEPITDVCPGEIHFKCEKPAASIEKEASSMTDQDKRLDGIASIHCTYQNQLGKKYSKTFKASFTEVLPQFFTFSF